jgi:hypothetical protein
MFNDQSAQRAPPTPRTLRAIMNVAQAQQSRSGWRPGPFSRTPTPLVRPARRRPQALGAAPGLKDESVRSAGQLQGAGRAQCAGALMQRLAPSAGRRRAPRRAPCRRAAAASSSSAPPTATTAAAGRCARKAGCRCVIVLHAQVSKEREAGHRRLWRPDRAHRRQLRRLGAGSRTAGARPRLAGGLRHLVRRLRGRAARRDAGLCGDRRRDCWSRRPSAPCPFTHVFLQGGVGGWRRASSATSGNVTARSAALHRRRARAGRLPAAERAAGPPTRATGSGRFGDGRPGLRRNLPAGLALPAAGASISS